MKPAHYLSVSQSRVSQSGVSLIEALVAMLVLALGVLGLLGIQLNSMSNNQNASYRIVASKLADDIFERMKANPIGLDLTGNILAAGTGTSAYALAGNWTTVAAPAVNCRSASCTPQQQAAFDLWDWQSRVQSTLPGGNATTFIAPGDANQLGVMVSWRLREKGDTSSSTYAARLAMLNVDVAGGATCPANSVCLVAYAFP